MVTVYAVSDTHGQNLRTKWSWGYGEILIHAGDITSQGTREQTLEAARQLADLDFRYKIFVPGNHDRFFSQSRYEAVKMFAKHGVITLIDETIEILGLRIHGIPWMQFPAEEFLKFKDPHNSFTVSDASEYYQSIPGALDILVSHQGANGLFDKDPEGNHTGSSGLTSTIYYVARPRMLICGHAHSDAGGAQVGPCRILNACITNEENKPARKPFRVTFWDLSGIGVSEESEIMEEDD